MCLTHYMVLVIGCVWCMGLCGIITLFTLVYYQGDVWQNLRPHYGALMHRNEAFPSSLRNAVAFASIEANLFY